MTDLEAVSIDPVSQQGIIVDSIMGDTINFEDPTNPLVTLTEAIAVTTSGALQEFSQSEKYIFTSLASDETDLYPHITNADEVNLFATPSKTFLKMFIDLNAILNAGILEDGIYKVTIPKDSYIEIDDVILTIPNDIKVFVTKKDDRYVSFVEHDITSTSTEFTNIGTVNSIVTTLEDNTSWVAFDLPVIQYKVTHVEGTATLGLDFSIRVPITDQYYFSTIEYYDKVSGSWTVMEKTFVESIYDATVPTAYIQLLENEVVYKVPRIYLDNIIQSSTLRVSVYTTKGKIRLPLNSYSPKDFKFYLYPNRDDLYKAAAFNMNYIVSSTNVLDGGVDRRTVRDMRKKFVYRTTGTIDTPITEYQLAEDSRLDGFYLDKLKDTLIERVYVASKDINDSSDISVPTYVYNMSSELTLMGDPQDTFLVDQDMLLVKPNTVFRDNNGIVKPLTATELNTLLSADLATKIDILNESKLLTNPFLYIIDNNVDIVNSRIYSVDRPVMENISIVNKNKALKENVNVTGYSIVRSGDDFLLFFKLTGNDSYDLIKDNVFIQLAIENEYGYRYFYSFVDSAISGVYLGKQDDIIHIVRIPTDNLRITSGEQFVVFDDGDNIGNVSLSSKSNIVIYYNGTDLTSTGGVQLDALSYLDANEVPYRLDVTGLTRETIDITLATRLDFFWNRVDNVFTGNKYKTYQYDIPLVYPEDVYDDTLLPFDVSDVDGDGICDALTFNIIHKKGDIVYDSNGDVVYEHRKGDIIYDEDGNPVIDTQSGILRYTDILMTEYVYKLSNKPLYTNHVKFIEDLLLDWILNKMYDLNKSTLDNTTIVFKARRSNNLVTTKSGAQYTRVLSPTVTIYYRKDAGAFDIDIDNITNSIGVILNQYFSKPYIVITDIKNAIKGVLDDTVLDVGISGYLPDDPMILDLETFSNRFEIKKTVNSIFDIKYEFDLKTEYI